MAGLPWFELDTDFAEHPKVRALATRLREPLADAYVARLYAYCYRQARDRFEADVATRTIEDAVRWTGRRGLLTEAMTRCAILEREGAQVVVHGVADRLGPHLAKRVNDAKRQQKRREKFAAAIGDNGKVTRESRETSARRHAAPCPCPSPSQSTSRVSSRDEGVTETVQTAGAAAPVVPVSSPVLVEDAEARAILALLPAKALDVSRSLSVPVGAVDQALEELRRRGCVRLSGGLVPLWEPVLTAGRG